MVGNENVVMCVMEQEWFLIMAVGKISVVPKNVIVVGMDRIG